MSRSTSTTEFAHFRFVRDRLGEVVELPSSGASERSLLVVDTERWGLARLRIYEGAASREDVREAFEREMPRLAVIRSDSLARVVSWGRDEEDLFFADTGAEGEALTDYLSRVGGIPVPIAADWILALDRLFVESPPDLPSFDRFTTRNLQVSIDAAGRVRSVFSSFEGWLKPGAPRVKRPREWCLAQVFCSLIGGIPIRSFRRNSLPRNFDEALDKPTRDAVLRLFDGEESAGADFLKAIAKLAASSDSDVTPSDSEPPGAPLPALPIREWLRAEVPASFEGEPEFEIPDRWSPSDEPYAVPGLFRGTESWIQVLPGPLSIPREGWLHQHHEATRRPGLPRRHELRITRVEDRGTLTFVGEERPAGIHLGILVSMIGPLSEEEAASLGEQVETAARSLEEGAGSCEIWWLPPENVFLRSGTDAAGTRRLLERREGPVWLDWQVKLRLHQTTRSLCEGVSLPPALRPLCEAPKRSDPALRRTAACLPLLFFLLTGARFRWQFPMEEQGEGALARETADWIEACRLAVRSGTLEAAESFASGGFFAAFRRDAASRREALATDGSGPDDKGSPPAPEAEEPPANENRADSLTDPHLEAALAKTLYQGDLAPQVSAPLVETEKRHPAVPPADDGSSPEDAPVNNVDVDDSDSEPPSSTPLFVRHLWPAVLGIVAALAVGYGLVRWNEEHGTSSRGTPPAFPEVTYIPPSPPTVSHLFSEAGDYMVQRGRLELLAATADFQSAGSRVLVEFTLRSDADGGDASAMGLLAALDLASGEDGAESIALLEEAALAGDDRSQFLVAMKVLVEGIPVTSPEEARSLLERAAALGHPDARELLGVLLHQEGDPKGARRWLEEAAREGHLGSIYQLGLLEAGDAERATASAATKAAARFAEAAERGEPRAMAALGLCHEAGFGLPPSLTEATRWMKSAALLGEDLAFAWCESRGIELPTANPGAAGDR